MPLLLLLLVAQLLDGAHRAKHHLGRQLGARWTSGLATAATVGRRLAVQARVGIGVGVRVGDVVVVEVATAAALMRHVARVVVVKFGDAWDLDVDRDRWYLLCSAPIYIRQVLGGE